MVMTSRESGIPELISGDARTKKICTWAVVLTPSASMTREECDAALRLSRREMQVLEGVAQGKTAKEIGGGFTPEVTAKTVESHIYHIKQKLELGTVTQLRVWAVKYFLAETQFGLKRVESPQRAVSFQFEEVGA